MSNKGKAFGAALLILLLFLCAAASADVVINEVMASNGYFENGHAWDWVELYNSGKQTVDLGGWHLSDSKKNPLKWAFPAGTKLKGGKYLTVWCTGETVKDPGSGSAFYTDYAISSSGETLILSDAEGNEVTRLKLPPQYGCVSYGLPAGGGDYGYLEEPTRNAKNGKKAFASRAEKPALLTPGGFYRDSVTVRAQAPEGTVLRYTTDGDTPTAKSKAFPADGLTLKKTAALRVRAFREDCVPSETVSASYFINDDPLTPIVSLITDDKYLFSKKTGILVKGTGSIPNYSKGWEYPTNIEYYTAEGECRVNQMATFTCSGHSARVNAQKSIAVYARKSWGSDRFAFNPFPTRDYESYKSILLRSANSDWSATRLRDVVASSLAEGQGILYQDHQVIQVYINGDYYGHYNLREKINKYFVAQYEGVTDEEEIDSIDILARTGTDQFLQNGDNTDWLALCDFCKRNDLNDPENLAYVEERLDIGNMFTHAAYEIILGNVDFTNVRVYRVPGGKWKYLLFDVEACWRGLDRTPLEYYIKPVGAKINGFRHEPLNALLNVPEYKARFLDRVAELLETVFRWDNVEAHFDRVTEQLEKVLPRHIARWKNMKKSNWDKNVNAVKYYARVRPKKIPELLKAAMKLTKEEVQTYFGHALEVLEEYNTVK
ncbi:MAG: CotH kinase family protein [Clostridia bacterium]|nr:CotH kinase family protein [Clostridia bacterium]